MAQDSRACLHWDRPCWEDEGSCQLRSLFLFKFANPEMCLLVLALVHEPQNPLSGTEGSLSGQVPFPGLLDPPSVCHSLL